MQYDPSCNMAPMCSKIICAAWPPVQYGRLYHVAKCAIWPHAQHGHLCSTATCETLPQKRMVGPQTS